MAIGRDVARVGEDLLLLFEYRNEDGDLTDLQSVVSVELLAADCLTVLATIAAQNVLHLTTGTYAAILAGSYLEDVGLYYDHWSYQTALNGPVLHVHNSFLVQEAVPTPPFGAEHLCRLSAVLVAVSGTPIVRPRVIVHPHYVPTQTDGVGVLGGDLSFFGDDYGRVSFNLVRGSQVTVSLVDSGLSRSFVVPDAETANLLTVLGDAPDVFTVVADNTQPLLPE